MQGYFPNQSAVHHHPNDTYKMFLGLIIKHQRVQMAPVHMSAKFWVRESFSGGR
jgi:hypothetical protein